MSLFWVLLHGYGTIDFLCGDRCFNTSRVLSNQHHIFSKMIGRVYDKSCSLVCSLLYLGSTLQKLRAPEINIDAKLFHAIGDDMRGGGDHRFTCDGSNELSRALMTRLNCCRSVYRFRERPPEMLCHH